MKDLVTVLSVIGIIVLSHVAARLLGFAAIILTGQEPFISLSDLTLYFSLSIIYFDLKKDALS